MINKREDEISLTDIENVLKKMYGEYGAQIIIDILRKELHKDFYTSFTESLVEDNSYVEYTKSNHTSIVILLFIIILISLSLILADTGSVNPPYVSKM